MRPLWFIFSHIPIFRAPYFCAKLIPFLLFSFPLCISVIDVLPVPLCLAFICWPVLLQLSVSQSAYDSQTSDELSSNQSMSFSPSNSSQHISCFDPGPSSSHSNTGATRQVSVRGQKKHFYGPGCKTLGCQTTKNHWKSRNLEKNVVLSQGTFVFVTNANNNASLSLPSLLRM